MSNLSGSDPVQLITDRPARTEVCRCAKCRAVEHHPSPLPTFGVTCGTCGEKISPRDSFVYASLRSRLFAVWLDLVAVGLPVASLDLLAAAWAADYAPKNEVGDPTYTAVVWITFALISFDVAVLIAYLLVGNARGRTVGKLGTGVRVVLLDTGEAPGLSTSIVRTSAQLLTVLTLGIGYAFALFDRRRRTLHDRIAGTIVVER